MAQRKNRVLLKKVALVLKGLREERGLTQQAVFDDTSIHIGRIETVRSNPTLSTISDLCKYFDVDIKSFFGMVEEVEESQGK